MKVRLLILIPRPLSFSSPTLEPAAGGGELIFIPDQVVNGLHH